VIDFCPCRPRTQADLKDADAVGAQRDGNVDLDAVSPLGDERLLGQVGPTRRARLDDDRLGDMQLSAVIELLHRELGVIGKQEPDFRSPRRTLEIAAHNRQHVTGVGILQFFEEIAGSPVLLDHREKYCETGLDLLPGVSTNTSIRPCTASSAWGAVACPLSLDDLGQERAWLSERLPSVMSSSNSARYAITARRRPSVDASPVVVFVYIPCASR
jgi:hypothetical protein